MRAGGADERRRKPAGPGSPKGFCRLRKSPPRTRKSKASRWSAERRAGPRLGPAVPSADGIGPAVRSVHGCGAAAPANFGAPLPSDGDAKGSKPTIWHDSPPGCAARRRCRMGQHIHRERTMWKLLNQTSMRAGDARLLRFARNDGGYVVVTRPPPSLREARSATKQSPSRERTRRFGETNPATGFGETNPRCRTVSTALNLRHGSAEAFVHLSRRDLAVKALRGRQC